MLAVRITAPPARRRPRKPGGSLVSCGMASHRTPPIKSGLVVATGYGISVRIQRHHLLIDDGFGAQRRVRRFHRTSKLRRLVIITRSGYLTFGGLAWLHDVDAAWIHVDPDGDLIAASAAAGPNLPALRRAQALAAGGPAGLEIARFVLRVKVAGQRALLPELPNTTGGDVVDDLELALARIERADELEEMLAAEAFAADRYWSAWAALPVPFPPRELAKTPEHWRTFGQRASLITSGPRTATNPANALLNYLYSLLEAETKLACMRVGLDPGIGVWHLDKRDRDSLALDLMEAVRPVADSYLLALLTQRTLSPREFVETQRGACRLIPRFAAELAGTCETWRAHVAPIIEQVAHTLAEHSPSKIPTSTPLTGRNWKRAWDERAPDRRRRQSRSDFASLPNMCRDCGTPLPDRRRRYCEGCRKRRFAKQAVEARARGFETLERLRSEQRDPAHGGRAAEIRAAKNRAHQIAVRDWTGRDRIRTCSPGRSCRGSGMC